MTKFRDRTMGPSEFICIMSTEELERLAKVKCRRPPPFENAEAECEWLMDKYRIDGLKITLTLPKPTTQEE